MTALTELETATALYVDFESLGNSLDCPAILGVLETNSSNHRFRQFVLDDVLGAAAVARKGVCVNATPEDAIAGVVEQAERKSLVVVSWSMHECAVVRATCSTDLANRFSWVHRNALDTVRAWKRHLHPKFAFALKPFGGKHPLKEYMRMIGYSSPANIRPAAPAKWLKHAIQQMIANGGGYRHITPQAKRDWHKLLVYNEHDCRGMCAVMVQAARELELWNAYKQTQFVVFRDRREIRFYAGYRSPALDELLSDVGATSWALLTAYNPGSARVNPKESERRQQQMVSELAAAGYTTLAGEGRDPTGKWPSEPSVLVPGISRREARQIGRRYGQLAVVVGQRGFPARLVASGLDANRQASGGTATARRG